MRRVRMTFAGGSHANEQLTAIVAAVLLPLLAAEGATLLDIGPLLTVHVFIGLMLLPVVALKLASTGWRMARYYLRSDEYVRRGPPHVVLRVLVAPALVASTIVLLVTGVALLALDRMGGLILTLHEASFIVWFGAMGLHVLTRVEPALRAVRRRVPGLSLRVALAAVTLVAGVTLATVTVPVPAVDHLQDGVSGHVGVDAS